MSDKKMNIMVNSNAMWAPSGYGQQVRQFVPKMAREGYQTAMINFYGQEGGIFMLDGVYQYPKISHAYGEDAMISHSKHFGAHVMFTLQDIWTLDINALKTLIQQGVKWIPIVPIDHEPVPPAIHERLKLAYRIVTYAPFGTRELKSRGMHSTYIPHTVDTNVFKKIDRLEAKAKLGIPADHFLFGMVAANKDNPPRKGFQHALDAFAEFRKVNPKSMMYMHTLPRQHGGFQIEEYAKNLGILNNLRFVDPYEHLYNIGPDRMAQIYSAFDCYLCVSENEGFGVPIIEASACEVPVIATDFTAMRDLVIEGETGYKLRVASKRFTPLGSYVANPDTRHLLELMLKVYNLSGKKRTKMGENGRLFVQENFDIELVWEKHWKPFLEMLEKEVCQ